MYDYEVFVPLCLTARPWAQRAEWFKRHGLIRTNALRVRIVLGLGPKDPLNDAVCGWPANLTVAPMVTPYTSCAQKVAAYLLQRCSAEVEAHSYMIVDDDSLTDMHALHFDILPHLSPPLAAARTYCFFTEPVYDAQPESAAALAGAGLNTNAICWHAKEATLFGSGALNLMQRDPRVEQYLRKRVEIAGGLGDHIPGMVAALAGVQTDRFSPFCWQFEWRNLMLCGGAFAHIHFCCAARDSVGMRGLDYLLRGAGA